MRKLRRWFFSAGETVGVRTEVRPTDSTAGTRDRTHESNRQNPHFFTRAVKLDVMCLAKSRLKQRHSILKITVRSLELLVHLS